MSVYDHELSEVEVLGWEGFISRQWESIFVGYRSWTGLRKMGRLWSDLIEVGLECSQDVADRLVRSGLIDGPDRGLPGLKDPRAIVSGMIGVLADLPAVMAELEPEVSARLLGEHARLLGFIQASALGLYDGADEA